jgi:hypothetical protein
MLISGANCRSPGFYLALSRASCTSCGQISRVTALALPEGHDALVEGRWQRAEANAFIFFINELTTSIGQQLAQMAPLFNRMQDGSNRNPYWVNHCEHCGAVFSDDDLHCEPGVFTPMEPGDAAAVTLTYVAEEFSADAAGYAFDPQFFDLMVRR